MNRLNQLLLFLHFVGLALGFSVSFANMMMGGLIAKAAPPDKAVLGRFPPVMSRLGRIGVAMLWATGVTLVYTRWDGFTNLPWQFDVKLTAVVLLTIAIWHVHRLERLVGSGDMTAIPRIEKVGKVITSLALVALLFAVLTFD